MEVYIIGKLNNWSLFTHKNLFGLSSRKAEKCRTHLPLYQNISVKIHTNFFLSSGGYNIKINYLKNKMRSKLFI